VHYAGQGALGRNVPFMPIQNFSPGSLLVGQNLTDGIPIPTAAPLDTAAKMEAAALAGSVGAVNAVALNTKNSRSLQWGMDLQHELKQGLLLDVGYVGRAACTCFRLTTSIKRSLALVRWPRAGLISLSPTSPMSTISASLALPPTMLYKPSCRRPGRTARLSCWSRHLWQVDRRRDCRIVGRGQPIERLSEH